MRVRACRTKVLVSFVTGWVLLLGQVAFTSSNAYTVVILLAKIVQITYGKHLCRTLTS